MGYVELALVLVVALVVFGPKDLERLLGKLGRFAGRVRARYRPRGAYRLLPRSGDDDRRELVMASVFAVVWACAVGVLALASRL